MNNPIQILLDPQRLINQLEGPVPSSYTDFYAERDSDFIDHKKDMIDKSHIVISSIKSNYGIGVVRVQLKSEALAKSHRPVNKLFNPGRTPILGGGDFGEIYFQVSQESMGNVIENINKAEEETRYRTDKFDKKVLNPTAYKSEVGAIEDISVYNNSERLGFSSKEAISWFEKGNTTKGYLVELFDFSEPDSSQYKNQMKNISILLESFIAGLNEGCGKGLVFSKLSRRGLGYRTYCLQIFDNNNDPIVDMFGGRSVSNKKFSFDQDRHNLVLSFLSNHPLVKKIYLPPNVSQADSHGKKLEGAYEFPVHSVDIQYPKAGIIDTGIRHKDVKEWCIEQSIAFPERDCDPNHGNQVASLIIGSQSLNGSEDFLEGDGCKIYDIWVPLHHSKQSFSDHFSTIGEFFDWLDSEIKAASEKGVRIFNFSINFQEHVSTTEYSNTATLLDEISEKYDVIFVVSAGNLGASELRPRWPDDPSKILEYLAVYGSNDRIRQPADAVRAITVGAINPKGSPNNTFGAPTIYSRRGPGVSNGVKPDVAHFGGYLDANKSSGLKVVSGDGYLTEESGTSFSAPLVTKTLAALDFRAENRLSRECLLALLVHHSYIPHPLLHKDLKSIARQFVGFGLPISSNQMLYTDDDAITIVFEGVLKRRQEAQFDFTWPASLVSDNSKCKGHVKLSLTYRPIIDRRFGAEYCRANVDASLQQEKLDDGNWVYRGGIVRSIWDTKLGNEATYEKNLIKHGLKWWPTKVYEKLSLRGIGKSVNWRLKIEPQIRAGEEFPENGIEFCAIMTIMDPTKQSNTVFDEMRQSIQSTGIEIGQIKSRTEISLDS